MNVIERQGEYVPQVRALTLSSRFRTRLLVPRSWDDYDHL